MLNKLYLMRWTILPLMVVTLAFVGCDDDGGTSPQPDNGFEAQNSHFQNRDTWTKVDYTVYPVNSSALGSAHAGNDSSVARMIYKNPTTAMQGDEHVRGSVYVKETFMWVNGQKTAVATGGFLGMAKRSGDFNGAGSGWEYFDLGTTGDAIAGRGADLMGGACQGCHSVAGNYGGVDYIFEHPTEYVIPAGSEWDVFMNANSWELVDSREGPDPLLGGAHGGGTMKRDVYRWQPGARYADGAFPIGTVIAKEVYELDQNNNKANITWTVMVKRGGDFNPGHNGWEWFMVTDPMDPNSRQVNRGADLMNNMCNSCHAGAVGDNPPGGDYVFNHPDLGF